jgi:hypothetical protein
MDTEATWQVCDDVETLIALIHSCKKELTKNCFSKFSSAKILEYKVFAPAKVCELLLLSENQVKLRGKDFDSHCHKAIADFEHFRLFKTKLFGDNSVRLEAQFSTGEDAAKYWFGCIMLV